MLENWGKYSELELFEMIQKKTESAEKAFSELYNRFSDRLFNYCLKILGSYQDAKDVYQETFVKFYQTASTLELEGSVSGLLFTIARNVAINYNRKNSRFTELNDDFFVNSEFEHENKEALEMISKALEIIPFVQKEAFVLRHYQGLSYDEISRITMTDAGTIRNRVKRAVISLQKVLKPYFDEIHYEKKERKKNKKKVMNLTIEN